MNCRPCIVMVAVCAALTGCAAPAHAPAYADAPRAVWKEGKAIVYVYREHAEPTWYDARISIDGEDVVLLPQQGFSWFYLAGGNHEMGSRMNGIAGSPPLKFTAEFEAGQRYHFEVTGKVVAGMTQGKTTARIQRIRDQEAVQRMLACCRYVPPEIAER